jgi:hypothetical protein
VDWYTKREKKKMGETTMYVCCECEKEMILFKDQWICQDTSCQCHIVGAILCSKECHIKKFGK